MEPAVVCVSAAIVTACACYLLWQPVDWWSLVNALCCAGDRSGAQIVDDTLRQAASRGINTVRMWAHTTNSIYPFQVRKLAQSSRAVMHHSSWVMDAAQSSISSECSHNCSTVHSSVPCMLQMLMQQCQAVSRSELRKAGGHFAACSTTAACEQVLTAAALWQCRFHLESMMSAA